MDPRLEFFRQGAVYQAVLADAGLTTKSLCHDFDAEVAFTLRVAACVAYVLIAFVDHIKNNRSKGCLQLLLYPFADWAKIHEMFSNVSG